MHHTPVHQHEQQTENYVLQENAAQCRIHSSVVWRTGCISVHGFLPQGVRGCATETDENGARAHRRTWVVGNKEKGEIWQALINRRKGAHHLSPCSPTDNPVDVYITYTSSEPQVH